MERLSVLQAARLPWGYPFTQISSHFPTIKNKLSWQIIKKYYRLKKLRLQAELAQPKNSEDLTLCLNPCGDAMPPSGVHSVSFSEFLTVFHHKNQTIFSKTYNVESHRIFMQVIKHNPRELLKLLLLVNNSLPKPYWTSAQVLMYW